MSTLKSRLDTLQWPVERALTTPIDKRFNRHVRPSIGIQRAVPRLHRRRLDDQAYCEWLAYGTRKRVYFGKWNLPDTRAAYRRFVAEWSLGDPPAGSMITSVGGLILRYVDHAEKTYRKRGKITSEVHCIRAALGPVNDLYGNLPAAEFTPKRLLTVQEAMLDRGWCRKTINDHIGRVVRCWSWGVVHGLVPSAVADSLDHVEGIVAGRTSAAESEPKIPVPMADVNAILPHLHPKEPRRQVLEAIIRFQLLTGCRPGEAVGVRAEEIDRTDPAVWRFAPDDGGKVLHFDKPRVAWLGPKAQALLAPYLAAAEPGEALFRLPPARKFAVPVAITVARYRGAIARACRTAKVPEWTPHRLRHNRATEVMRLYECDEHVAAAIGNTPEVARQVYCDRPEEAVARRIAKETG